jgi:hypothetical protein
LEVFAALLDRSVALIADATADARTFDRQAVVRTADVWDNNTFPFFRAAAGRTAYGRERRARRALAWMAGLGPARWAWMAERAAEAGYVLGVPPPDGCVEEQPFRTGWGPPHPGWGTITVERVEELARDYDLAAGRVAYASVEKAGRRLTGAVLLEVPRRFRIGGGGDGQRPARLRLDLDEVTGVILDSDDLSGLVPRFDAAGNVELALGSGSLLTGRPGRASLDDIHWAFSTAGRAADRLLPPPRRSRPTAHGLLPGGRRHELMPAASREAGWTLYWPMIQIRCVRLPNAVPLPSMRALSAALRGAGTDVLAAGRDRAALRALTGRWRREAGPHTAALRRQTPRPPVPSTPPAVAELRMLTYEATGDGARRALLHLAVPPGRGADDDTGCEMLVAEFDAVRHVRVETAAFGGVPGEFRSAADGRGVALHGGALVVAGECRTPLLGSGHE